jgi:hypothetical protein
MGLGDGFGRLMAGGCFYCNGRVDTLLWQPGSLNMSGKRRKNLQRGSSIMGIVNLAPLSQ